MLGVVGEDDRPEPAVVIFRDAADEPYRIVVHYSLRSLFNDLVGAGEPPWRYQEAEGFAVFRNPTTSQLIGHGEAGLHGGYERLLTDP